MIAISSCLNKILKDIALKNINEFLRSLYLRVCNLFPEYPATYFRDGVQLISRIYI